MKRSKVVFLFLYYAISRHLPLSYNFGGRISSKLRYWACRHIFEYCGEHVNIEKGAYFGKGDKIRIGNNSGLGENCFIPNGSVVGENVMMGANIYILQQNHKFERTDIPMCQQGYEQPQPIVIDDDVWIGNNVNILAGRHIAKGSIIGIGSVLTKDFPAYSIVGGNPAKLIRSRIKSEDEAKSNHREDEQNQVR